MKLFPLAPLPSPLLPPLPLLPPPESPTVMLSAGSFSSPYEHLSQPETKRMVEHYTAYLSDNTRLIANPGLKVRQPRVRPEPSLTFPFTGRRKQTSPGDPPLPRLPRPPRAFGSRGAFLTPEVGGGRGLEFELLRPPSPPSPPAQL